MTCRVDDNGGEIGLAGLVDGPGAGSSLSILLNDIILGQLRLDSTEKDGAKLLKCLLAPNLV